MRLIDLGMVIEPAPGDHSVRSIERWSHEDGPTRIGGMAAPYLQELAHQEGWSHIPDVARALPDGVFLSNDLVHLSVHAGTHVDAPWHYGPTSEDGPAERIDDLDITQFFAPAMALDLTSVAPRAAIGSHEIDEAIAAAGGPVPGVDVVLVRTGWDHEWPNAAYFDDHPGMSVAALDRLLDLGARVIGIDTAGFDRPAPVMLADFGRTGGAEALWPCHLHGRSRRYLQIERMANLEQLPSSGFWLMFAPVRVARASAGWVRPVAVVLGDGESLASVEAPA